jgi:putative nucleotidyltransferase with HDIG domain
MSAAIAVSPVPAAKDHEAVVHDALRRLTTISTLPEVTAQIIKTVEDPKSSAGQLHKIVSHDPALVTRILKVVNSSFYGLPGQIASVERAIVLLGLNGVKNLAVAASLGQLFRGVKLCEPFEARDLWTHCIAVAVTARELAMQLKLPLADEAFLAGMIHDVGLLAHMQLWPEKLRLTCEEAKRGQEGFCSIERRVIGMDHEQLGRGLAQRWRFPQHCQDVAGSHHQTAGGSDDRLLVNLVHIGDTTCCQLNLGFNLTALNQQISDAELSVVGIERSPFDELVKVLPEKINTASALFA